MNPLPLASGQSTLITLLAISAVGLLLAIYLARYVLAKDSGSPEMQKISDALQDGVEAYLDRQNRTLAAIAVVLALSLYMAYLSGKDDSQLAVRMTISFLFGAIASIASTFGGIWISTRANLRVAVASPSSVAGAMQIALRGGAVTGLCVTAASLFGVGILFAFFDGLKAPEAVPRQIMGFALGASVVALFAQMGGGIFQLLLPNERLSDHLVDCAGRGADIFQSVAAQNVGAMVIGVTLFPVFGLPGVLFPLFNCALGLLCSVAGVFSVTMKEAEDPAVALRRGFYLSSGLALGGFYMAVFLLLGGNLWLYAAGVLGILASAASVLLAQHPNGAKFRLLSALTLAVALLGSYFLGEKSGVGGYYGIALASIGLLSNAAYVLSLSSFAAIAANAAGETSRALVNAYAIASAAPLAFLLIGAFVSQTRLLLAEKLQQPLEEIVFRVDLAQVPVWVGVLLGVMLMVGFQFLTRRAVRQGLTSADADTEHNAGQLVDRTAQAALKAMILPGLLPVLGLLLAGVWLKALPLAAMLISITISGTLIALLSTKGSPGPSLPVLIQLLATLSLVAAPLFL